MTKQAPLNLSRRERQILEILFRLERASASEVASQMPDAPTTTTVRGLLRVLERKGHVRHDLEGPRYVFSPVRTKRSTGSSVLAHVVRTFFHGSPAETMASLLGSTSKVSDRELDRLTELVARARKRR